MRSGGGLLQSLLYNRYTISKRGSLGLITGSDCMESFDGMKTDLSALSASYEAANLIFKTAQDGHANEPLFNLFLGFLQLISISPKKAGSLLREFKEQYLHIEGLCDEGEVCEASVNKRLERYLDNPAISVLHKEVVV